MKGRLASCGPVAFVPPASRSAAKFVYPALFFGLFAILPIAIAREDKCTNAETAFMIAKRFASEKAALRVEDAPDFPWFDAAMTSYEGGCVHTVRAFFDRKAGAAAGRTGFTARVRYDVLMNRWSLESWQTAAAPS